MSYEETPWDHAICVPCWYAKNTGRIPHRIVDDVGRTCCWCKRPTSAGVYVRHDPDDVACKGIHLCPN